ncbi:MAG: nitronate monooxygenase [Gammaproteobacteria bacterium]
MRNQGRSARLHTPVCDLFGCEYPVVLAGMGGVSRSELVAAVINAGSYGFLGMVREPPEKIRSEIQRIRERSDREFGINMIPAATDPDLLERQIEVCIEQRVASVCLFWDIYPEVIKRFLDAGIIVVHQIGSEQDAAEAEAAGCHVLIVQGIEAGGHVRGKLPLRELLPRILRSTDLPVLAAGGIITGDDLAENLRAGAQGVVMGTAFLATTESYAHDYHKQRIVEAKTDETILTDIFHINWPFGAMTRVMPNSVTRTVINGVSVSGERKIIGVEEGHPIYLYSTDSPLRNTTGDLEAMAIYAGSGAHLIKNIEPVAVRLQTIINEAGARMTPDPDRFHPGTDDIQLFSSPCFIPEAEKSYMGLASDDDITGFLEELLDIERDFARVVIRSWLECHDTQYMNFFRTLYQAKARWCKLLVNWIVYYRGRHQLRTGDIYRNAMSIHDIHDRVIFITVEQSLVIKKIREMLVKIDVTQLQEDLQDILTCHIATKLIARKIIGTRQVFPGID